MHKEEPVHVWKFCLPIITGLPVLAMGLDSESLVSLRRSWKYVDVYNCGVTDIIKASERADELSLDGSFNTIETPEKRLYHAAAIGNTGGLKPEDMFNLIRQSGSAIWINNKSNIPSRKRLTGAGFTDINEYAFLPRNPHKVMLPVNDPSAAKAGLGLYAPGKTRNRLLIDAGRALAGIGGQRFLSSSQAISGTRPGPLRAGFHLLDWLKREHGIKTFDMAAYVGSPRPSGRNKAALMLLDDGGRALAMLKIADRAQAADALNNEMELLVELGSSAAITGYIPHVLNYGIWQGHSYQIHEFIDAKEYASELTPEHINFLGSLSEINLRNKSLRDWSLWQDIIRFAGEGPFGSTLEAECVKTAVSYCGNNLLDVSFPFHRIHGDFTPWNIFLNNGKLIALDWESSQAEGLPFFDIFHFALRKRTYVQKAFGPEELFSLTPETLGIADEVDALSRRMKSICMVSTACRRRLIDGCLKITAIIEVMRGMPLKV